MKKWRSPERCNLLAYAHPVLRPKLLAVQRDVQGHFDQNYVRIEIFETGRSDARQAALLAEGTSRKKRSPHQDGRAGDLVPYVWNSARQRFEPSWAEAIRGDDGRTVWELITAAAEAHGLERVWFRGKGGRYVDGPHVQLPKSVPTAVPGW